MLPPHPLSPPCIPDKGTGQVSSAFWVCHCTYIESPSVSLEFLFLLVITTHDFLITIIHIPVSLLISMDTQYTGGTLYESIILDIIGTDLTNHLVQVKEIFMFMLRLISKKYKAVHNQKSIFQKIQSNNKPRETLLRC